VLIFAFLLTLVLVACYIVSLRSELRHLSHALVHLQVRVANVETALITSAPNGGQAESGAQVHAQTKAQAQAQAPAQPSASIPPEHSTLPNEQPSPQPAELPAEGTYRQPVTMPMQHPAEFALPTIADRLWTVLKQNSLAAVGVGLVLLGCSFLFPMLVLHGLFPPALRLALAVSLGVCLMAAGLRLSKRMPPYAHILEGGGAAVIYLTVYAAMAFYELLAPPVAFALFAAFSALVVVLSHRQAAKPLAFLGFTGAYLAPVLTVGGTAHLEVVLAYGLLVDGACLYVGLHLRWIEMSLQGFIWSLLLAFGIYTGHAPGLALWMQQTFLVAYFALFACYPWLYANRKELRRADAYSLQMMTGLLTPVVLGFEYWIAGKTGLTVAALLVSAGYLGLSFFSLENAPGLDAVHAALAIFAAVVAILAPGLDTTLTSLLAGGMALCVYMSFPGRLRWLGAVPGVAALTFGLSPLHAQPALMTTAIAFVIGYVAVMRRHEVDGWVVHALSAMLTLVSSYALFRGSRDGSMFGYTLPLALVLATATGWWYRRSGDFSALACHAAAATMVLLLCLRNDPVGVVAQWVQIGAVIAACTLAVTLVNAYPTAIGMDSRLFVVIAVPVVLALLAHQHVPISDSFANRSMFAGWTIFGIAVALNAAALRPWLSDSPALQLVRYGVTRIALPCSFAVQWVCAVGLDMYPASTELQTLWMTSAIVLLAGTSPRAVVRAASAIGIMLLLAYLLALAELRAAITLAWAVVALTALVAGSRVNDRILWIAGAGVSTLVVTKLIGLDMHTASPIWRVLSFIGSGLLFVLAGYLAPAPVKNAGRSGAAMHRP
jgi:uncharacterized membrane protein